MPHSPPVDCVQVWTALPDLAHGPRVEYYRSLLTTDELDRCDRFVHEADRVRFLLARALVRTMLSEYVAVAPREWRFRIEAYGRPEVAELPRGAPDLRFNLSHTPGLVACAVTVGRDVGLDVENVNRALTAQLPERFFSAQEVADLRALPTDEQHRVFFDYWTLKESYIKARGLGLALPLRQFTFLRRPGLTPAIRFAPELHDDPASWQFAQFWPTRDHRMAVAVRRDGEDLPIDVTPVDLPAPSDPDRRSAEG
jgi:4'-phosphopantetheinyl transferase